MPKWNPVTKVMEPDPSDPTDMPIPGIAAPAVDSGGAPPPVVPPPVTPAILQLPARPEHETTSTTETRAPNAVVAAKADLAADAAAGAGLAANAAEEKVTIDEGKIRADAAQATADAQKAKADRLVEIDRLAAERAARFSDEDDKAIAVELKQKKAAAGAEAHFWDGRAVESALATLFRGIDRAASSFRGEQGPTASDRIVEKAIAAHEKDLVGAYEASKEGRADKARDYQQYLKNVADLRIAATNQSLAVIAQIDAKANKGLAALAPQRAAAIRAQKDALVKQKTAELKEKRLGLYTSSQRDAETNRSPTANPGAATAAKEAGESKLQDLDGREVGLAQGGPIQARKVQEMRGLVVPILRELTEIKGIVANTGYVDRIPGVGGLTEDQKRIKSKLDTILAQTTQFLGSGTPQDAEAKRKLEALSVSLTQGKKVTQRNIDDTLKYFGNSYQDHVRAAAPTAKLAPVKDQVKRVAAGEPPPVEAPAPVAGKPASAPPVAQWTDEQVKSGWQKAIAAKKDGAVAAFAAEMKRRQIPLTKAKAAPAAEATP